MVLSGRDGRMAPALHRRSRRDWHRRPASAPLFLRAAGRQAGSNRGQQYDHRQQAHNQPQDSARHCPTRGAPRSGRPPSNVDHYLADRSIVFLDLLNEIFEIFGFAEITVN